jgi:WD40 repeat protein
MGADSVAVNPSTQVMAAAGANGQIYLGVHRVTGVLTDPASPGALSVAFSPHGKYLAAGDANGRVYLWKVLS